MVDTSSPDSPRSCPTRIPVSRRPSCRSQWRPRCRRTRSSPNAHAARSSWSATDRRETLMCAMARSLRTPRQAPPPTGQEFVDAERFRQVVVAARDKPLDAVLGLVACREEQHRAEAAAVRGVDGTRRTRRDPGSITSSTMRSNAGDSRGRPGQADQADEGGGGDRDPANAIGQRLARHPQRTSLH